MGGAPVYLWPGGGITVMTDVTRMPKSAFGYVPTPAIVAPIEFTLPRSLYQQLGGHAGDIVPITDVIRAVSESARIDAWQAENPWPFGGNHHSRAIPKRPARAEPGPGDKPRGDS
jgi:hypothetical protein